MPHIRKYRTSDKDAVVNVYRETAHHSVRAQGDPVLDLSSYMFCRPYLILEPENVFVLDDDSGTAVGYIVGARNTEVFFQKYVDRFIPYLKSLGINRPAPPMKVDTRPVTGFSDRGDDDQAVRTQVEAEVGTELKVRGEREDAVESDPTISIRSSLYAFELLVSREDLHPSHADLMSLYPSHLHIDILPAFQRKGHGRALMEAFCTNLQSQQSHGVQVIIAGDNEQGETFYQRVGFGRFDRVLDGGKSGEVGRDNNTMGGVKGHIWLVRDITSE